MSPLIPIHDALNSTGLVPSAEETLHWLVARTNTVPNTFQRNTIITGCVMIVITLIVWNLPVLRDVIAGLKLLTVGIHELCHLIVGLLCGGQVWSICIDPNDGGATTISGLMRDTPRVMRDPYAMPTVAQMFWSPAAVATLSAGYVGSSIVGWLLVFCAFDIVASKIAALVIHFAMLVPILRADSWIAFTSIIICEAVLIGLWFGDHGNALRFYILFLGDMNLFYMIWDYVDERLFDKRNSSDCAQFSHMLGWPVAGWAIFWFLWESLVFVSAIFAGICVFRASTASGSRGLGADLQRTDAQMYAEASHFLPT